MGRALGSGHRLRHVPRRPAAPLRALLLHQGREGNGARAGAGPWHREAARRLHRRDERGQPGNDLHRLPAARGCAGGDAASAEGDRSRRRCRLDGADRLGRGDPPRRGRPGRTGRGRRRAPIARLSRPRRGERGAGLGAVGVPRRRDRPGAHRPGAAGRGRCASLLGAGNAGPGPRHRALRVSDRRRGRPAGRRRSSAPEAARDRAPRPRDPRQAGRGAALSEAVPCSARRACHHRRVRWWQTAVVYQIYPRSFADATGDGVGDLAGIRRRLDHLAWLGVDALWLSPIFRSPMKDFGYDVADYCDVDPLFGTLADFDRLLAEAHARGIRVLLDWVPNHTSDQHPWFRASRASRESPKRAWYVWRDPAPGGGPPNNWLAAFPRGTPAWTFDAATGQYYLHLFLPEQPDLDWSNPDVRRAMHDVLRFWLDRGVDGFRVDVVHGLGKDPRLPDLAPELAAVPQSALNGEELGLEDAVVPPERAVDPGARDGCRAPIPWDASPAHGWPAPPWLPWPPAPERRNVERLRADPGSILHLYRRLLALRRASAALHAGSCRLLEAPAGVLAYERAAGTERRLVLVNFTGERLPVAAHGRVEIASDGTGEDRPYAGVLAPAQALVLRA